MIEYHYTPPTSLHGSSQGDAMQDVDHIALARRTVPRSGATTLRREAPRVAIYDYSNRLPTLPRIVVPPPTSTAEPPPLQFNPHGRLRRRFLEDVNLDRILQQNTLLEWAYELRRRPQMVLPFLYLGPMGTAKDAGFLKKEGITMVLAVRPRAPNMTRVLLAAHEMGVQVQAIDVATPWDLPRNFPTATKVIDAHLNKKHDEAIANGSGLPGKVLVICESGNDKSAAVVAAYLMAFLDQCDHIKAMQICQSQRFCVNFDDTLKEVLRAYWDIVSAKRSVSTASSESSEDELQVTPNPSSPTLVKRNKRGIDDADPDNDSDRDDHRHRMPFQDVDVDLMTDA